MKISTIIIVCGAIALGYYFYDPFRPEEIEGKRVLITGASMGIGEQLAYHYAKLGANVMIVARSEDRLKKVIENCQRVGRKGGTYLYHVADLSKTEQTGQIIAEAERSLGGLDYLVLNHIISEFGLWEGSSANMTRLRNTMEINFYAYVQLASDALPALTRSRGNIVVMSSVAGQLGQMMVIPYSTSKHAVNGFFTGLRIEHAAQGSGVSITLCTVGLVATENAIKGLTDSGLRNVLESVQAADPADVAYDIVRGAALRKLEVYTPYIPVNLGLLINFISPKLQEMITIHIFKTQS